MDIRALLEQMLESGREATSGGRQEVERRLGVPEDGPERDAMLSGMKKGAIAAGILGLLLGSRGGRRLGGTALKLGSLAAIGTLAYKAVQKWRAGRAADAATETAPADTASTTGSVEQLTGPDSELRASALLKAMIGAAKADGHIDDAERARIMAQLDRLGLDDETARLFGEELEKPLDPQAIAAGVDSPEAAAEMYLASLLVIDVDDARERHYLDTLAGELGLAPELAEELEAQA